MAGIGKKTAFVLTGGGSLGAVQVGMLRVLLAFGVQPDSGMRLQSMAISNREMSCSKTCVKERCLLALDIPRRDHLQSELAMEPAA